MGCVWIGRASINQAEPEGFRGGRDSGKRVVKDREERGREREMMVLVVMVVLLGSRRKRECGWRGGEKRRGAQRLQEWWGESWTVG